MTYSDFLAELGKAGLTVRAFADLIGMNRNSVSNYAAAGEVPRHLAVIAALLAEMSIHGLAYNAVIARINLTRKKPRGAAQQGRFGGDRQDQLEFDS
ncbi:XRE family transcriptional regulator [Paraburkholderia fungorum]|uniref:XRE family transcriptional regulator n=1 Tax=Paraburkholderia fungorum TaxID=134537 RepID=UPI0033143AE0